MWVVMLHALYPIHQKIVESTSTCLAEADLCNFWLSRPGSRGGAWEHTPTGLE